MSREVITFWWHLTTDSYFCIFSKFAKTQKLVIAFDQLHALIGRVWSHSSNETGCTDSVFHLEIVFIKWALLSKIDGSVHDLRSPRTHSLIYFILSIQWTKLTSGAVCFGRRPRIISWLLCQGRHNEYNKDILTTGVIEAISGTLSAVLWLLSACHTRRRQYFNELCRSYMIIRYQLWHIALSGFVCDLVTFDLEWRHELPPRGTWWSNSGLLLLTS